MFVLPRRRANRRDVYFLICGAKLEGVDRDDQGLPPLAINASPSGAQTCRMRFFVLQSEYFDYGRRPRYGFRYALTLVSLAVKRY